MCIYMYRYIYMYMIAYVCVKIHFHPPLPCYTTFYPPDLLTSLRNTGMCWKLVIEPMIQWEAPISIDQNFDKRDWYIYCYSMVQYG
jgi:hypothetical protein